MLVHTLPCTDNKFMHETSVANFSHYEYTKSNLKIYQIYTK